MPKLYLHFIEILAWMVLLLFTAQAHAKTQQLYSQPWLVQSKSFCFIIFHFKAEDVKKHLPAGVEPQLNDKGLVTAFFEIYQSERIAGLPSYKTAFIVVDIAKHPSTTGVPGHFAIWGKVDSESMHTFFQREFGFPYQYASTFDIKTASQGLSSTIGNYNGKILSLSVEGEQGDSSTNEGSVNMLAIKPGTGLVKSEVLYLSKGRKGKLVSLTINAQHEPVLNLLKQSEAQYVWVAEDQIFTYSQVTLAKEQK